MVKRAQANGVSFEAVDCDTLYGRSGWLRDELHKMDIEYYADVPCNTMVFLHPPTVVRRPPKRRGAAEQMDIMGTAIKVEHLLEELTFETFSLRKNEGLDQDQIKNLEKVFQAAKTFADDPSGWLVFTGTYGSGKTHLAAAIANFQLDVGKPPLFIAFSFCVQDFNTLILE